MSAARRLAAAGRLVVLVALVSPRAGLGAEVPGARAVPSALRGVGIRERLGERLPLELTFRRSDGRRVRLGELFSGARPVVLSLVYFDCPMLCNLVTRGLVRGLRGIRWKLGRDYSLVTVSFDERDTPARARILRRHHLQALGLGEDGDWTFLTGGKAELQALAGALGYAFRYDARTRQFAHPAVVHVLNPDGRISRYLHGIDFPPRQLRLALTEAAWGRAGPSFDRLLLQCYRWDPALRRYGFLIGGVLRTGGLLVLLGVGVMLGLLWRREWSRAREGVDA